MNTRKRSSRRAPRRKAPGGASPPKPPAVATSLRAAAPNDPPFLKFWKRANGTLPEKIKEADLKTLNSALGFLFARLRQARGQFDQGGDNGRQGAITALAAFRSFITLFKKPLEETLHVPILRLQDALDGLDQNRIEQILKPARRRGRAPSGHAYDSIRGNAVATLQRLQQAGLARNDALQAVARQLTKLGVRPERGPGTVTATTVQNWCDEVSSDVSRQTTAALMYDDMLSPEENKRFLALPKDRAKQFALRSLSSYVLSISPGRPKPT